MSEGEVPEQALAVARADHAGMVDGVHVDFRHPHIPPGEWEAREWWFVGADDLEHAGLLFPSEAMACEEEEHRVYSDNGLSSGILEKLRLPRAYPGDRLTVERVDDVISDRRFDHRHDATVKHAHLVLRRAEGRGEEVRPNTPLAFYGITQLRDAPERDAYDRLAERILAEHGNPDPHRMELSSNYRAGWTWLNEEDVSLSDRAGLAIEKAEHAWFKLMSTHLRDDPEGQASLRWALNQAVLAAFFQAKHELGRAEKLAAAAANNLAKGPATLRNTAWHDYATSKWSDDPTKTRSAVFKEMVIDGVAAEDEKRSVLRSLLANPLCPDRAPKG